jgi:hypothetical protein
VNRLDRRSCEDAMKFTEELSPIGTKRCEGGGVLVPHQRGCRGNAQLRAQRGKRQIVLQKVIAYLPNHQVPRPEPQKAKIGLHERAANRKSLRHDAEDDWRFSVSGSETCRKSPQQLRRIGIRSERGRRGK